MNTKINKFVEMGMFRVAIDIQVTYILTASRGRCRPVAIQQEHNVVFVEVVSWQSASCVKQANTKTLPLMVCVRLVYRIHSRYQEV